MNRRLRQYVALIAAAAIYYIVHEGAHAIYALAIGAFKKVNILYAGIQVDVYAERMSDAEMGWFCLAGALATLLAGWCMIILTRRICACESALVRTIGWYATLALLFLDPLYLTVLYEFVGGGDMNGIRLLASETAVRIVFGILAVIHLFITAKHVYPSYKKSFSAES